MDKLENKNIRNSKLVQLFVIAIFFNSVNLEYFSPIFNDTLMKSIYLFLVISLALRFGFKYKSFLLFTSWLILIYFLSNVNNFGNTIILKNGFYTLTTLITGIISFSIAFDSKSEILILKSFTIIPALSSFLGVCFQVVGMYQVFVDGRFGGASNKNTLALFALYGVISSVFLKEKFGYNTNKWILINFLLLSSTVSRVEIFTAVVFLLPDIKQLLKNFFKNGNIFIAIIISSPLIFLIGYFLISSVIQRTFIDGSINTSGRDVAWNSILSMNRDKIFGNGLGTLYRESDLTHFKAAHNEYLRTFVETGWVGLILTIILLITIFALVILKQNVFKLRLLLMILGYMIQSYYNNTMISFTWFFFLLFLGFNYKEKYVKFKRGV